MAVPKSETPGLYASTLVICSRFRGYIRGAYTRDITVITGSPGKTTTVKKMAVSLPRQYCGPDFVLAKFIDIVLSWRKAQNVPENGVARYRFPE